MISNIKILKEMTEYEIVKDINNDIIRITRGTECL
jgi:Trp operon repressor